MASSLFVPFHWRSNPGKYCIVDLDQLFFHNPTASLQRLRQRVRFNSRAAKSSLGPFFANSLFPLPRKGNDKNVCSPLRQGPRDCPASNSEAFREGFNSDVLHQNLSTSAARSK